MPQDEAKGLSSAVSNVARHYPNLAGHEKMVDWVMLIQTLGMAYGVRFYLAMPKKPEPKKSETANNQTVLPFPGGGF